MGGIIGAYIGGSLANHNFNPGKWNWSSANTYIGMVIGGGLGAATGYGIATGYLGFNFAIATPFVAVGINYSTNDHGERVWDGGYTTIAGGYYDYGVNKAGSNAGKAYDNAVTNMRNIYNSMQADLSNISIPDLAGSLLESGFHWSKQNITIKDANLNIHWFSDTAPTSGGTATINSIKYGKELIYYGSKSVNTYLVLETIFNSANILFDENISERNKWVGIGSKFGGLLGGFLISSYVSLATSFSGVGAIVAAGIGFYAGNVIFSSIGGVIGGLSYDAYQAYLFKKSILEINNNTIIYQNSIQY